MFFHFIGFCIAKLFHGVILLNFSFGGLFFLAERRAQPELTIADSIWWAVVTMTTVGYGDFRPTKKLSKMLAVATAFVGLVFTGIVVAIGVHAVGLTFKKVAPLSKSSYLQGQLSTTPNALNSKKVDYIL